MSASRVIVVLVLSLFAAGCGWSPPPAPPTKADTCTPADAPSPETVDQAIAGVPPPEGAAWQVSARGHTADCRLSWVLLSLDRATASSPQQVLFFDRNTPLGPATPQLRPYINVTNTGDDTVTVQYQWLVGDEPSCCPTGIGTVRFRIGDDGKLGALDPIPNG